MKGKGEKERYTHLNAEFQRLARRDNMAFLTNAKKIGDNNIMRKTIDLFKKIRGTKGNLHALLAQSVKNLPGEWETQVRFLHWEDPLEKGMATLSGIPVWRIPEEPGGL